MSSADDNNAISVMQGWRAMHKLLTCQVSFHLHRQHRPTLGGSECQTSSPPMQAAAHFAGPTPRTSQASEMLRLWQSSKRQLAGQQRLKTSKSTKTLPKATRISKQL